MIYIYNDLLNSMRCAHTIVTMDLPPSYTINVPIKSSGSSVWQNCMDNIIQHHNERYGLKKAERSKWRIEAGVANCKSYDKMIDYMIRDMERESKNGQTEYSYEYFDIYRPIVNCFPVEMTLANQPYAIIQPFSVDDLKIKFLERTDIPKHCVDVKKRKCII